MNVLRDIFRRKSRSILTISGIGIGVFTLVVLGAVAENMNVLLARSSVAYDDVITVVEAEDSNYVGMSLGTRPFSKKTVEKIRAYPGVTKVSEQVNIQIEDEFTGIPPMILSDTAESPDYADFTLSDGRRLAAGERGVAVLGVDLAKKRGLRVGDTTTLRGEAFAVIGVLERTYMPVTDSSAYVALPDAQDLYYARLPEAFRRNVVPSELVLQANVYGTGGQDLDRLSERMTRDIDGILASGPTKMKTAQKQIIDLINGIVWSIGVVALVIGALSVVNTMTVAVRERTREIGVKRALGATRRRVRRDVLLESAVLAALGGAGGLVGGALVAAGLNAVTVEATGTSLFLVTGRLMVGALCFAVGLGVAGGLRPAIRAARLEPSVALTVR